MVRSFREVRWLLVLSLIAPAQSAGIESARPVASAAPPGAGRVRVLCLMGLPGSVGHANGVDGGQPGLRAPIVDR